MVEDDEKWIDDKTKVFYKNNKIV
ncbi:hypothetical protein [Pseudothermotoga sp.]